MKGSGAHASAAFGEREGRWYGRLERLVEWDMKRFSRDLSWGKREWKDEIEN